MAYVGSHFGMGLSNTIFIIIFFILGSIIGIQFKILSSLLSFYLYLLDSFFGKGNGTTLSVLIFFILEFILLVM